MDSKFIASAEIKPGDIVQINTAEGNSYLVSLVKFNEIVSQAEVISTKQMQLELDKMFAATFGISQDRRVRQLTFYNGL